MAITIHQSASLNSNAYNRNEYVLSSTNSTNPKFKYNVNVLFDTATISAYLPVSLNGLIYTKLTVSDNLFAVGDKIFIEDNGNCNIVAIDLTAGTITVDYLPDTIAIQAGITTCNHVISYSVEKEPVTNLGVLNIGNTLKNKCTHKLLDSVNPYWSDEILFEYKLALGTQYEYIYSFEDNMFSTGNVGFYNTSLSASYTASIPFQIGDQVIIQQDLYEWPYTDNVFYSGSLAFTGSSAVPYPSGSQVYVTGQQTNPQYNGYSTVITGTSGSLLVTDKTFGVSSPVEGGSIFGTPQPSYNDVATITDIYWTASLGIVITTDLPYGTSSPAISGTIKYADGTLTREWEPIGTTKLISTGKFDKLQEQVLNPETWHIDNTISGSKKFASIITLQDSTYYQRIEPETKSWVLIKPAIHSDGTENTASVSINMRFKDANGSVLGTGSFNNLKFSTDGVTPGYYGIYMPVGLNQLAASTTLTSSLGSYINSVHTYEISGSNGAATIDKIQFKVNTDCGAGYDTMHLLFKDSFGSWLSVPFKYKSYTSTETDTKTYYAKEGQLNSSTNQMQYTAADRGKTNIYKRYTDKFKLNSGWLTDAEAAIIKDLLTSPVIYLQDENNIIRACQLLDTELDIAKSDNVSIVSYTMAIAVSIDELRF